MYCRACAYDEAIQQKILLCELFLPLFENAILMYLVENQLVRIMTVNTDKQELEKEYSQNWRRNENCCSSERSSNKLHIRKE